MYQGSFHVAPCDRIQRAERFVEQQYLGVECQRAGDRDALAHTAGKLLWPSIGEICEPDEFRLPEAGVADIFVSYTSSDRDWAFWIGQELEKLGHLPSCIPSFMRGRRFVIGAKVLAIRVAWGRVR